MRDDEGSALVEFTYLAVLLLVPLVYLLLTVFQVQRAAFASTEAARQAGRAFARASTVEEGQARAFAAADLAFEDQGIAAAPQPKLQCVGECLAPGTRVRVTVVYRVRLLPLGSIPVRASHTAYVDRFVSR